MRKEKTEKSYIYFAKDTQREMKVGETSNLEQRQNVLWSTERINVSRYVSFNGTKDERLFVESYLRTKYSTNSNLRHYGNDHFKAQTKNNLKGAENRFFVYVAEAFALLEQIKGKAINFNTYDGRYSRSHNYLERLEQLRALALEALKEED